MNFIYLNIIIIIRKIFITIIINSQYNHTTEWPTSKQIDSIINDPLFKLILKNINNNNIDNNINNDSSDSQNDTSININTINNNNNNNEIEINNININNNDNNNEQLLSLSSSASSSLSTIDPLDYFFLYDSHQQNQSDLNLIPFITSISSSSSTTNFNNNNSSNYFNDRNQTFSIMIIWIILSIILICLILATIVGNVFVISAVILERSLRSVGNYLVVSLAVTDLLVACLVMPIGAIYEVTGEWNMGIKLCEIWTFVDVLCCTTSIFHLLAISCDRLWAVTTVDYIHRRKAKHVCAGIAVIWLFSAIISLGPMLGWKDDEFVERIVERKECMISQDISYQIFATIASFYAPSILLLLQYYRIYQVAKTRLKLKKQRYQYRIRRRPSFYRTRKESELKEFPRIAHRVSLNTNEEFTSTAIQPPISSSSGVYSSSTNTDNTANTNTTTNTTLSNERTSIVSISPPTIATLKIPQSPEPRPPNISTAKRFSIVQFFHPQPVEQKLGQHYFDDDSEEIDKYDMTHFDDYGDNNDLQSNETSIDESTVIVGAEPASNIVVYIDDYGSTICSSCDPTDNYSSGNGTSYYQHENQTGQPATAIITTDERIDEENEYDDSPFDEIAIDIDNENEDDEKNLDEITSVVTTLQRTATDDVERASSECHTSDLKKISINLSASAIALNYMPNLNNDNDTSNGDPNKDEKNKKQHNENQQLQQNRVHHHHQDQHQHKHNPHHHHHHTKKHKRRRIKKLKFKNKILRFDNNGEQQKDQQNKQESKAAKTLTIITGVFIICWLPFFVIALVMPLCGEYCYINRYAFDFFIWLGWANSTLNPFLYTIFSPDFRNAFKKLSKRIRS